MVRATPSRSTRTGEDPALSQISFAEVSFATDDLDASADGKSVRAPRAPLAQATQVDETEAYPASPGALAAAGFSPFASVPRRRGGPAHVFFVVVLLFVTIALQVMGIAVAWGSVRREETGSKSPSSHRLWYFGLWKVSYVIHCDLAIRGSHRRLEGRDAGLSDRGADEWAYDAGLELSARRYLRDAPTEMFCLRGMAGRDCMLERDYAAPGDEAFPPVRSCDQSEYALSYRWRNIGEGAVCPKDWPREEGSWCSQDLVLHQRHGVVSIIIIVIVHCLASIFALVGSLVFASRLKWTPKAWLKLEVAVAVSGLALAAAQLGRVLFFTKTFELYLNKAKFFDYVGEVDAAVDGCASGCRVVVGAAAVNFVDFACLLFCRLRIAFAFDDSDDVLTAEAGLGESIGGEQTSTSQPRVRGSRFFRQRMAILPDEGHADSAVELGGADGLELVRDAVAAPTEAEAATGGENGAPHLEADGETTDVSPRETVDVSPHAAPHAARAEIIILHAESVPSDARHARSDD
ncbi:hypothetical protein M885DRAFT_512099 [Pelagophyceae sp. CCMP2097]|nr:hypothetical protein M885DRAFT_512099 [Pelagophyceae sp. CCMP2097]|mmetsp:Transcript_3152/g.9530  ORF Transcript_3152/g.9530 Transcript_3152/m.9530 type:complete len:520 (+) Transcript_3152:184-1743(+)